MSLYPSTQHCTLTRPPPPPASCPSALFSCAARDNTLVIGSSVFFHVPNDQNLHMRLPGGVEAWAGYRQAVKPCQFGLSFNIDLAATAFLTSGPMVDVLASVSWGGGVGGGGLGWGCEGGGGLCVRGMDPRTLRAVKDTCYHTLETSSTTLPLAQVTHYICRKASRMYSLLICLTPPSQHTQVLQFRDPRQMGEGLHPRALRAVKVKTHHTFVTTSTILALARMSLL